MQERVHGRESGETRAGAPSSRGKSNATAGNAGPTPGGLGRLSVREIILRRKPAFSASGCLAGTVDIHDGGSLWVHLLRKRGHEKEW